MTKKGGGDKRGLKDCLALKIIYGQERKEGSLFVNRRRLFGTATTFRQIKLFNFHSLFYSNIP